MIQRTNWLMDMMQRTNVGSIIQLLDTPGGESRAASGYVSVLQRRNKPVLSYGDGMVASLGVHFSSASDEFYLSNEMDQVGSIGSYCTLLDFSGYLEKEGVKMLEIYAPQSTDKNGDYRAALAGDTSAIEADLKLHVDQFIKHVSTSRPKSAANVNAWNTGKMFYANESKKIGLSDGVMAFDKVVSKAAWLGKRNKK
jgi:ClpP class serine protease